MASKSQTIQTYIRINATSGGFGEVGHDIETMGTSLLELGTYANQVSQELINFGKESVTTYKEYEKSLAEAEVALATTYGKNTAQLAEVMEQLDTQATEWAATTIFHTDDVANAIAEAARSGWDLEHIMSGIPAAMELAQAGSMDLSQSVDMIVKIANAAGIEFEDIGAFIDHWAFSANSSATNIEEMGEAMLRMGGTMRFGENTDEILTLIAAMADAGYTGSEAGTLIRNTMLRMIAPTEKASDAMALLGVSAEEIQDTLSNESVTEAMAALEETGFSAFDNAGQLKPTLQIFEELGVALADIAGGYDNIAKNDQATSILSAIFPTRTITGALNLLNAAANGWDGLYESLQGGDAEGYGTYASETMMDTLYGNIEIFYSKLEALKQHVGEALSDEVTDVLGVIGSFVDGVNNMDDASFNAIVSGLEVIAVAGPGLAAAGLGMKFLTAMASPAGLALAAFGVGALARAFVALEEADIEGHFGSAAIDSEVVETYADKVRVEYTAALSQVNAFNTAVAQSVAQYEDASSKLSGQLLTAMLTKKELSPGDITNITGLAEQMHRQVLEAIANSNAASMSYWDVLFGNPSENEEELPKEYLDIMSLANEAYEAAVANAESIGENIRNAMTDAFSDGEISPEEYNSILEYMRDYNDAISEAQAQAMAEDNAANLSVMLHKAQTASLESILATSEEIANTRDEALAAEDERYWAERGRMEYRWNQRIEEGYYKDPKTGRVVRQSNIIAMYRDDALAEADRLYAERRSGLAGSADETLLALWTTALTQSGYSDILDVAASLGNGGSIADALDQLGIRGANGARNRAKYETLFDTIISQFGGEDAFAERMYAYGDTEMGRLAQGLYTAYSLVNNPANITEMEAYTPTPSESEETMTVPVVAEVQGVAEDQEPIPVPVIPEGWETSETSVSGMLDLSDGLAPLNDLTAVVGADTTNLEMAIEDENHKKITTDVYANMGEAYAALSAFAGQTVYVNVVGRMTGLAAKGYAEGGRATEASIFGEAGPEWAIPEEHTQRTAELLDKARAASGFTWPDLLSRLGGLNANTSNTPSTIIYSPTINANDVSGVKQALDADKARFEKWFAEREARNAMEVYA